MYIHFWMMGMQNTAEIGFCSFWEKAKLRRQSKDWFSVLRRREREMNRWNFFLRW